MLNDGIIERSKSEWAAPIVLIKKKDGSLRLCVDYRRMNAVTQTDAYPMPRIDDLIDRLGKRKYITTLDLTRGYLQVPVTGEDQHKAVQDFPIPTTKKEVRSFLGLTGYYRRFMPDYAANAVPLTELTRKSAPNKVQWNNTCQDAFEKLKKLLCSQPVLWSPNFSKEFILQTDASDYGIGAVLSQFDAEGIDHPVAYYSGKLLPREQRYSTVEKECLAIKLATHAFRVYLLGRKFTIQTDHRALQWLDRVKENNSRLTRWSLALQLFKFEV